MSCPIITEESLYIELSENKVFQDMLIFFCVVCSSGSIIVLLSLFRSRPLSPHLLLVASLCFSDLVLCSGSAAFLLYFNKQPGLVRSCQTNAFFTTFGVLGSLMSFGMITIERYLVICHGLQNHAFKTAICIAIALSYAILTGSLITSSPEHVGLAKGVLCGPLYCSENPTVIAISSSFVVVVLGFLTSVVYCPYKIMQIYNTTSSVEADSIHAAENFKANTERKKKERKIFIKLSIITAVFVIMMGPLALALVYEITTKTLSPPWLVDIYNMCLGGNSALNPFLLYFLDNGVKNRVNLFLGIQIKPRSTAPSKQSRQLPETPERSLNLKGTVNVDMKDTVKLSL